MVLFRTQARPLLEIHAKIALPTAGSGLTGTFTGLTFLMQCQLFVYGPVLDDFALPETR
jgi:hypothetical protein